MVMHSLSSEFTLLRLVNGEAVAPQHLAVANGFVKPKLGELGELGGLCWDGAPHPQLHLPSL